MDFMQANNSAELFEALKKADLSKYHLASRGEYLSKLEEIFSSIIMSSLRGTAYDEYDQKENEHYLSFTDKSGQRQRINKYFIDHDFILQIKTLFDDVKEKIQNNDSKAAFLAVSMVNVFAQDCYNDTKAGKTMHDFMKWLTKYVENPNSNPKFSKTLRATLLKFSLTDNYDHSVADHFSHAANIFMKYNLLNSQVMLEQDYFANYSYEELLKFHEEGILSSNQLLEAFGEEKFKNAILDVQGGLTFWQDQKNYTLVDFGKKEIQANVRKFEKQLLELVSIPNSAPLVIDTYLSRLLRGFNF